MKIWPGRPYPLGAHCDGVGTNFSLFSEVATRVELCLFEEDGRETKLDLPECFEFCWHGYLPGILSGQRYGFRVHGPWDPSQGKLCNPAKLLLDPYAKAFDRGLEWDDSLFGYPVGGDAQSRDERDSAPFMPRCVVPDQGFDWEGDAKPARHRHDSVIYEAHVRGFTALHPGVPPELRGTYAGLAHPEALRHLKRLGVTAVELQPVHQFVHDRRLLEMGLRNYWGYNTIGFFAPHLEYSSDKRPGGALREFKAMVRALHRERIEVILDVVYNHTAEGGQGGPLLSFRGVDNEAYYRLGEDKQSYVDFSGTGNALNMRHPHVLQLIMDSLRYWATEMRVDGFRFDLAAALARQLHQVDRLSAFFDIVQQDPVISSVKLIAEPWDLGPGGYQVGKFPPGWSEWNGKYRDCVRDFWRGQEQSLGEFATRFTGSSDLYQNMGRRPVASVNFITAHDGFCLEDLVSYNQKHNEMNGEGNRDGSDDNRSWNCGAEGPSSDPAVLALRRCQKRNMLVTLLLSQGLPMLLSGDELGRSQQGNNNAYCQDNAVSWIDWARADGALLDFCARLIAYQKAHPAFRRRHWFGGKTMLDSPDIAWFRPDGARFNDEDWKRGSKSLAVFLNGDTIPNPNPMGDAVKDDSFYLAFNAHHEAADFKLPPAEWGQAWLLELDTSQEEPFPAAPATLPAGRPLKVEARSLAVLRRAP
jgi:isoamylase